MVVKNIADGFTLYAAMRLVGDPMVMIFSGKLWGGGAFLAGAIIVSAVMFGEFYFRGDDEDAFL